MSKISLSIAEDQPNAVKSILKKLKTDTDFEILNITQNGDELLKEFRAQPTDIVLMDIEMPILNGISATEQILQEFPDAKVLMLTTFDADDKIFKAILAGASGYILKDESAEAICKAIHDVFDGGAVMSPGIALKTFNHIIRNNSTPNLKASLEDNILSPREVEILTLLKEGLSYKNIAQNLFLSEGTIRKHVENIYRKLQVNNKISAVNKAVDKRWI